MKYKRTAMILCIALGAISCKEECAKENGTLPAIDLSHLRPAGSYFDPRVTVDQEKMEYINDSTVVISFTADKKTVKMTYRVKNQGTYESIQSKFN